MFVERDNLPVKYRLLRLDLFGSVHQLRILRCHLDLIARNKTSRVAIDEADRSESVPLCFEDPLGIGEWLVNESCEHRIDLIQHASLSCARAHRPDGFVSRAL